MIKTVLHRLGHAYIDRICRTEFSSQSFRWVNERPIEYRFVFEWLNRLQPKQVLDVGVGTSALPSLLRTCGFIVTATDNVADYWPKGMVNRHFYVINDDIISSAITTKFDVVLCVSTLEHISDHVAAASSMIKLLRPGGHLLVTCPYREIGYVRNVYELPNSLYGRGNPYICQSFSRSELESWLANNNATIVDQEYWQCFTGKHWTEGQIVRPPVRSSIDGEHQLTCLVIQKRLDQ